MKTIYTLVIVLLSFISCQSVRVNADYDKNTSFDQYKNYAFHKDGIDKVEISDLDKKRILRALDQNLSNKGLIKSEKPDVLINFFTKEREQVTVSQFNMGWGWGWGWNPFMMGGNTMVDSYTEGTLYIDIIDAKTKELIWQGIGSGVLTQVAEKKDEKINLFVTKILEQYPPKK
ncbi:MAG: DUF4136 domain-containing protein [Flavobacterium sp.]